MSIWTTYESFTFQNIKDNDEDENKSEAESDSEKTDSDDSYKNNESTDENETEIIPEEDTEVVDDEDIPTVDLNGYTRGWVIHEIIWYFGYEPVKSVETKDTIIFDGFRSNNRYSINCCNAFFGLGP